MNTAVPSKVNSSFSLQIPGLQLAVDSTSLGEFKSCPRKYQLGIVLGYQPRRPNVHLVFGIAMHRAREGYDHAKARGRTHEEGIQQALRYALQATWEGEAPGRPWQSGDPKKNRLTLALAVVGYFDHYGEEDQMETVLLASGKPAVELSFTMPTGRFTAQGEEFHLCGHMDRAVSFADQLYISDIKSTGSDLGARYWSQFAPHNQFSLYNVAAQVVFNLPVHGLIVDAVQVGAQAQAFQRQIIPRTREQNEEWFGELGYWFGAMEVAAIAGHWPQNDKACDLYGGCQFREVCRLPPGARQPWLDLQFTKRVWDPLERRGE